MTDLNKLRSEFEGIPEIKAHLDHGNVFWSDKNQTYASEFQCPSCSGMLRKWSLVYVSRFC